MQINLDNEDWGIIVASLKDQLNSMNGHDQALARSLIMKLENYFREDSVGHDDSDMSGATPGDR